MNFQEVDSSWEFWCWKWKCLTNRFYSMLCVTYHFCVLLKCEFFVSIIMKVLHLQIGSYESIIAIKIQISHHEVGSYKNFIRWLNEDEDKRNTSKKNIVSTSKIMLPSLILQKHLCLPFNSFLLLILLLPFERRFLFFPWVLSPISIHFNQDFSLWSVSKRGFITSAAVDICWVLREWSVDNSCCCKYLVSQLCHCYSHEPE